MEGSLGSVRSVRLGAAALGLGAWQGLGFAQGRCSWQEDGFISLQNSRS